MRRAVPLLGLFVTLSLVAGGCAELLGALEGQSTLPVRPNPPNVRVAEVRVANMPTARDLAAYYCSQYLGPFVCQLFGAQNANYQFAFDLDLEIANPNQVPLPLFQALVAFDAYPDARDPAALGKVCASLCEDASRCSADAADACSSSDPLITNAQTFANAAVGFLYGVVTGTVDPRQVSVRTVPPAESVHTVVRLTLDAPKMLDLMRRLGRDIRDDLRAGRVPTFEIPYQIQGAVWVDVQSFGRIGANFGPHRDAWQIASTQRATGPSVEASEAIVPAKR